MSKNTVPAYFESLGLNFLNMRGLFKDISGQRYGKLTVIKRSGSNKHRFATWLCRCDCSREIIVSTNSLNTKHYVTCGRCICERTSSGDKKVESWQSIYRGMKDRCYNKKSKDYQKYGGRGISICEEWLRSIQAFKEWSENSGYARGLTIDRINNDGNYCPENCRWATPSVQANNKSTNHIMIIDGVKMNVTECANKYGINRSLLYHRLNDKKMSDFDAVHTPIGIFNGR